MARSTSSSKAWTRMLQRQTRWLMRQAVSEGKKTVKRAVRASASSSIARAAPTSVVPKNGVWATGIATGPAGVSRYKVFKPTGLPKGQLCPLIVMLHGCGQSANDFAATTRMNKRRPYTGLWCCTPNRTG